ncbi:MAG: hypothetical protein M3O87_04110 [Candidatus Dormibacteraeota bacterium]|nr:hypothetical protein [Candidatus Dormibacteraeota bacterium]
MTQGLLGAIDDPKATATFVLGLVGKTFDHQLNPFFRGTVTSVVSAGAGVNGYLVQVRRAETSAPDGIGYLCAIPGYTPSVGDDVDCMWRDAQVGYVFAVLRSPKASARVYRAAAYNSVQPAITVLPYDAVTYDPGANFSTATATYTCPVPGFYDVSSSTRWGSGANPFASYIYKNGVLQSQGGDIYGTAFQTVFCGHRDRFICAKGDLLTIRYNTNAVVAMQVGEPATYAIFKWDGPA